MHKSRQHNSSNRFKDNTRSVRKSHYLRYVHEISEDDFKKLVEKNGSIYLLHGTTGPMLNTIYSQGITTFNHDIDRQNIFLTTCLDGKLSALYYALQQARNNLTWPVVLVLKVPAKMVKIDNILIQHFRSQNIGPEHIIETLVSF